jgi:hypothetical protein|tara:strand:- start:1100 stop:1474 length:375 start_codon:yes stop_codon:yes gene_type:complete
VTSPGHPLSPPDFLCISGFFLLFLEHSSPKLAAKAEALATLLKVDGKVGGGKVIARVVRREPSLLTFDVERTLSGKVAAFESLLPGLDVTKLLTSVPRLLTTKVEESLPRKLEQLGHLLPGLPH